MVWKAAAIWCIMLVIAVVNGTFRVTQLIPRFGDLKGHWISTLLLSCLLLLITWVFLPWVGPHNAHDAWLIGMLWLALTLTFELLAGHFVFHNSWGILMADYNLLRGRIWLLVLVVTLLAPLWVARALGLIAG